jgi:serpin B
MVINSYCTHQEKIDNAPRNLDNSTSSFIYNVIPNNPGASITPEYSAAINTFSVKLLSEVYNDVLYKNKNVILCPFNIGRSLAILTEGATGKSKSELLEALGGQTALDNAKDALSELLYADNSIILQCADALWINSSKYVVNQTFKEIANTKYGVEYSGLDFNNKTKTVNTINSWISSNTNQYITNAIDDESIQTNTVFLLTNAIFFKADWASPFNINETHSEAFPSPNGQVMVDMMSSDYIHEICKTDVYENARLYYGTKKTDFFYLDIYMPTTESIETFLDNNCLSAISRNDSSELGALKMPKFSFKSQVDLIPMLKQLGIEEIFNPDNSDLAGIASSINSTDSVHIYVDKINHIAGIETDEEGTKAYATTVTPGETTSAGPSSA